VLNNIVATFFPKGLLPDIKVLYTCIYRKRTSLIGEADVQKGGVISATHGTLNELTGGDRVISWKDKRCA